MKPPIPIGQEDGSFFYGHERNVSALQEQNRNSTTLSFNDFPLYAVCLAYPEYVRHYVFECYGAPKWPISYLPPRFFRQGKGLFLCR